MYDYFLKLLIYLMSILFATSVLFIIHLVLNSLKSSINQSIIAMPIWYCKIRIVRVIVSFFQSWFHSNIRLKGKPMANNVKCNCLWIHIVSVNCPKWIFTNCIVIFSGLRRLDSSLCYHSGSAIYCMG